MLPTILVQGTGSIGMRHLSVIRQSAMAEPFACPVRPERVSALAEAGYQAVSDWASLPRIDGIIVATDTGRHLADALAALQAGWPVLIEKPVTPTADGLDGLAAAARQADRPVFVAAPLRFAAGLRRLRDLLPAIGAIHAVRAVCQSYLPTWRPERDYRDTYAARADEGGVLRDLIHEIDYTTWLFGRPAAVCCTLQDGLRLQIASEAGADLLWQAPGDVSVSLRLDYLSRIPRRQLRAHGAWGDLTWDAIAQTVTLECPGQAPIQEACAQTREAMMTDQFASFLTAITGQPAPELATLDDGAFAISLCDAARRSATIGHEETILPWQT